MRTRFAFAALALFGTSACGAGVETRAFSPEWQNDDGRSITAVRARLGKTSLPTGKGYAVGISKRGLVGIGLDGTGKWTHPGRVDSRPSLAGDVVLFTAGQELVALDAGSGRQLWKASVGDKLLRGAGDDGHETVATLGSPGGGGSLVLVVDRSGTVVRRWSPDIEVGVSAIAEGVVFAPWGSQYVSALDVQSGDEIGRLLGRVVMSRAVAIGGSLYFGESALVRFDDAIGRAARNEAHVVKLAERELPGKPSWFPDGTRALPPAAGATDSVRFYARPAPVSGGIGLDSERFAATYFRIAVGFHDDGAVRWVRVFPSEIIGGDATRSGFALCDEHGDVWFANARNGADAGHVSLGEALEGCVVSGGDFEVKSGGVANTLAEQITTAIELRETQMATIQRFLVRELATSEDPLVTKTLLDLASDGRTQPEILEEAKSLLASRRTGVEYMLEALRTHYDFLSDVLRPPPVGPLADALAAIGEKRAAPLLAAHLNDPSDTPDDVRRAARALTKLATGEELEAVRTFFSLYRATADDDALVAAVLDAAKILVEIGAADGKEIVERAAEDPLTQPAVKEGLASLVGSKKG
jgi:outer membrane protein assembly factor BamB